MDFLGQHRCVDFVELVETFNYVKTWLILIYFVNDF